MSFWYFGYGSNMDTTSLRAKGVEPRRSEPAVLWGWQLAFNVQHFFLHEGGVGNIVPSDGPGACVRGVVHLCDDEALAPLDLAEAYPDGYDRIGVRVQADSGEIEAVAYVGTQAFVAQGCLPSQRYLNILVQGATRAGLDAAYVQALRSHPVLQKPPPLPFVPPKDAGLAFTLATLAQHPQHTGLAGWVFDMSQARWQHRLLWPHFGGKDMTLFHLRRMDNSDGNECDADVRLACYSPAQRRYLDEFLQSYLVEYRWAGRLVYA